MGGECFICVGPATERYTLVLEDDTRVEAKLLCEECVADVRDVEWIDVYEGPVLTRGGDDDHEAEHGT